MRSGILASLIVVAWCACVTTAERSEPFSRGDILIVVTQDPNDPNAVVPPAGADPNRTWDPAEHLVANWESVSVSMTSRLFNPAVRPDVEPPGPEWSISLRGQVDIIDSNGLIGWALMPTSVAAFDQDGNRVSSTTSGSPVRMYQPPYYVTRPTGPDHAWESVLVLNQVSLNLPMEPDATYPEVLSRVEWTMNVLVAEEVKTADIPFQASETWVELVPGMEILVEQATVEEGKYQYRIKLRYDRTKVDYLMGGFIHLRQDQMPPAAAVLKMEVLNAQGESIRSLGGGGFSSSSAGGSTGTASGSGSGSCEACGTAATFRFTVVYDMYELEARLAVENIPVPHF